MGNVTSSLKVGNLESLANAINEARSDPSAVLDSLNTHGRKLASSLSDAMKDTKQDPSAVLDSLHAHGRNVAASLSNAAVGDSPLIANLLDSFGKYWHKVVALLPISQEKIFALVASWWIPFTVTITLLYLFGGFGRAGVRGSSPASKFQSRAYGGYTPRDGIFARSTSAGMRGSTPIIYKAAAIVVASFTTVAVYRSWVAK